MDPECIQHCFPTVPANAEALKDFPTPINESVNAQLSPLAHTVHHLQRWACVFLVSECVDVHNIMRGQAARQASKRSDRKRIREGTPGLSAG